MFMDGKTIYFLLFIGQIALWIEHVTLTDSPLYRLEMGLKTRPYCQPHPYQCRQCCEINKSSEKKFNQFMLTVKPWRIPQYFTFTINRISCHFRTMSNFIVLLCRVTHKG